MDTTSKVRAQVSLDAEDVALLDQLAQGIGCTRSAVAAHLLYRAIASIQAVPPRKIALDLRHTRKSLGGHDAFMQEIVRRSRGVSEAYISEALDSIISLAEGCHASYR